jgi:hypothetical protein
MIVEPFRLDVWARSVYCLRNTSFADLYTLISGAAPMTDSPELPAKQDQITEPPSSQSSVQEPEQAVESPTQLAEGAGTGIFGDGRRTPVEPK